MAISAISAGGTDTMKDVFVTIRFLLGPIPEGLPGDLLKEWISSKIEKIDLGDLERIDHSTVTEVK